MCLLSRNLLPTAARVAPDGDRCWIDDVEVFDGGLYRWEVHRRYFQMGMQWPMKKGRTKRRLEWRASCQLLVSVRVVAWFVLVNVMVMIGMKYFAFRDSNVVILDRRAGQAG